MFSDAEDERLLYKLETENPTHSFKDRGSVIEVAKAKEYGFDEVSCASTGNMAYSVAYYSKLYGLRSRIFVSNDANKDKIEEIRSTHDAVITRVKGDFTEAQKDALKYSEKTGAFITGDYCYRKEGQKTIAYEIISSLDDASNIIVPVGNATLLSGTLKALHEMEAAGSIRRQPKVIAVQSDRCDPFSKAFNSKSKVKYAAPSTSADAIAVGYPTFGDMAAVQLRLNGGMAVSVSEASMREAQKRMMKEYGITIELASAATIAAYKSLKGRLSGKSIAVISGGNV
jgi:threonine synthase